MIPSIFLLATAPTPLTGTTLKGNALLDDLEHRAVKFFWEQSSPTTGFTKDRASNFEPDTHTVSSCAATGFALAAYPIGVQRKWLSRTEALQRTRITLTHLLSNHDGKNGWLYHFVDWQTGKRQWNCELSTIDTSIALAGVWMARQYWKDPEVTRDADEITRRIDWHWVMKTTQGAPDTRFISMGWKPEDEAKPAHGWIPATWSGYCELLMLYIQAYGASDIPTDGWNAIKRNICHYDGQTYLEGGPLFMHEMTNGFYNLSNMRDQGGYNYWVSTKGNALANRAFCIDNPKHFVGYGAGFWGLTACDMPDGYGSAGTPPRIEGDNGTVAPTCAIAALPYIPEQSLQAAESMYQNFQYAYGTYGFSNGINPTRKWRDPDVLGIDLGMMLLGIEDARTGLPWRLSMSHPMVKRGYERAGLHYMADSDKGPLVEKGE